MAHDAIWHELHEIVHLFMGGFDMENQSIGALTRVLASVCTHCPVCRTARRNQKGLLYSFVKTIEGRFCPFCMAYERVYGKKAHER